MSKIILKKSSVPGRIPVVADLDYGEFALNFADGALYYLKSDNTVHDIIRPGNLDAATLGGSLPAAFAKVGIANHFTDTTNSTSPITGAIVVDGGVGIGGNLFLGGNASIAGNLTVQGITTTNLTTNNSYTNAVLELNKPTTGFVQSDNVDSGVKYNYFDPTGFHNIVKSGSGNGTTATFQITGAPLPVGGFATIVGVVPSGFNGTYKVTASDNTSVTLTHPFSGTVTTTGQLGTITRITEFQITSGTSAQKTATVNYSVPALALTVGDTVTITGCTPSGYNGTYTLLTVGVGTFTYQTTGSNIGPITVPGKIIVSNRFAFSGWSADTKEFEYYKVGAPVPGGTFAGIYGTYKGAGFVAAPTGPVSEAEITNGLLLSFPPNTVWNNTTATSGTVAMGAMARIDQITLDSINAGVTYTNAASLYIAGAPIAGHNVTLTTAYALEVASGNSLFGGQITHSGLNPSTGTNIDQITTRTQNITLIQDWIDTGISDGDLATGTYFVQLYANDAGSGGSNVNEYYSGTLSWYAGSAASADSLPTDEIPLHRAGGGSNGGLYLRTYRPSTSGPIKLQIFSNTANASASNYVFKFRRVIQLNKDKERLNVL